VKADAASQVRLLDLQAADTGLAQLEHRRRTLPEGAALAELEKTASALADEVFDAEARLSDIDEEQRRLERDVDAVRARADRDQQRLQGGGLPARELESLQHEVATLARRQATLEDELLEVMEQREDADAALAGLLERRGALDTERAELTRRREEALAGIEAAVAERTEQRSRVAAELPGDLLALYERARQHGGGVGAAALRQRRCEGCHIELSGAELSAARAAAPDDVLRCDNCRRILVRTPESGL
jgi:predicted  nucleic acid-binding Zn-ribbon protein